MILDTKTIIFILSIVIFTQFLALAIQYRAGNKSHKGIGWWLVGTGIMAIGVIFMPFVSVPSLLILAMIANPLLILGKVFLYIGIIRFLNKKENQLFLVLFYLAFSVLYYFFIFVDNDIVGRAVVVNGTMAIISFLIVYTLFSGKDNRFISFSADFIAITFLIYGSFMMVRLFWALTLRPIQTYLDHPAILNSGFIVLIIASCLWTFGFILMVNQRLNVESTLDKERFQLVFNTTPDASLITRLSDGLILDVNDKFSTLSGFAREGVVGKSIRNINFWKSSQDNQLFLADLKRLGSCDEFEAIMLKKDGNHFFASISAKIITIQNIPHVISLVRDISSRKKAEIALMESEEQYRSILNASPDDITITDLEGRIIMISPAAKKMFGYDIDFNDFVGMQLLDFVVPDDLQRAQENIARMYENGETKPNEYRAMRKDKSIFDIEVNSGFVRNSDGHPIKMVFIIRDITERKLAEKHIQNLVKQLEVERNTAQFNSITDSLTGLANRRYFDIVLTTEFFRLKRSEGELSLIMIDVDYFKKFNDNYGHIAGDECLTQIGSVLKNNVGRASDLVARFGGEEFVIVLPETNSHGAKMLAEKIRKEIEELEISHAASQTSDYVTVSLGVVSVKPVYLISPNQVLELADKALYNAKNSGRNQTIVTSDSDDFINDVDL
jgi:diguanylate cyclase (GGDEF)-like protein/PAS domain S-box-containing protein